MIDVIKELIDKKITNLHPDTEKYIIEEALNSRLKSKRNLLSFMRKRLEIPKIGKSTKEYWRKRGWSDEEIEIKRTKIKMPTSPMKFDNWLTKINEETGNFYTIEESKYKIKTFRKSNKEYWIKNGHNEESAIEMVKMYQKSNSKKLIDKMIKYPEKFKDKKSNQIGYWLKKGLSEEESKYEVSKRQNTTSLEFYINKFGEEQGKQKYDENIKKISYTSSRKYYIDKFGPEIGNSMYDERLKKRHIPMSKASKESILFLKIIYKHLRKNGFKIDDIKWGVGYSTEWFINTKNNFYFYDFTILPLRIIIEYHGKAFHPNPNWDENIKKDWKCLFSDLGYEEKLKIDLNKKETAKEYGFSYIEVYSEDDFKIKQNEIINIINEKIKILNVNREKI